MLLVLCQALASLYIAEVCIGIINSLFTNFLRVVAQVFLIFLLIGIPLHLNKQLTLQQSELTKSPINITPPVIQTLPFPVLPSYHNNQKPCQSIIIYIKFFFRRMYFKERQRSQLYKRQQHLEQIRLNHKIQQIKHRKLKLSQSENYLPPITHRVSQIKPCQKAAIEMETERLKKRIFQLKSNKSDYFAKVVGINLSELSKSKLNEADKPDQNLNKSCLKEDLPFQKTESKTIDAQ